MGFSEDQIQSFRENVDAPGIGSMRVIGHESAYNGADDYNKKLNLHPHARTYKNGGIMPSLHTLNSLMKNPHQISEHETDEAGARVEYILKHPSVQKILAKNAGVSDAQILRDAGFDADTVTGLGRSEHGYHFPLSDTDFVPIISEMQSRTTLGSHDVVGTTFWVACNLMLAFTMFFFFEVSEVPKRWQRSVTVAGMVTGIAFWNYCYMRDTWVRTQSSPTVYRYTDWLITVPLQIVEFYLILQAVVDVSASLFNKLLATSVIMLVGGWLGECGLIGVLPGFIIGMAGWLYIVYEVFAGECSQVADKSSNSSMKMAYNTLRLIVSVGWTIYPLGYYIRYLIAPGSPDAYAFGYQSQSVLNIVYNLADLVNKGAFGMAIYAAAITDRS